MSAAGMGKPYNPKDHYFHQAHKRGLRARSAFKIEEILNRFALVHAGASVLDIGAAPGGFLQILADAVGPNGRVLGIDRVPIQAIRRPQVRTAVIDVLAEDLEERLLEQGPANFDAIISDLAPKTTGIRTTDQARSMELADRALQLAVRHGKKGGCFVAKLFMGEDFEVFRGRVQSHFREVKVVRPEATRSGSTEIYLVGLGKR
jgi:23S rRNA (uridine2552-2'-O)-methyltransferase